MDENASEEEQTGTSINPSNEAIFRTLRNYRGKTVQCQHHIDLLERHVMNNTAPRGLTVNIQPNVPQNDTDFLIQWEKLKLDFQSKLLLALCEFWKRHKANLEEESTKLEQSLKANTTQEEWQTMQELIQKTMTQTGENYKRQRVNPRQQRRGRQENSSQGKSGSDSRGNKNNKQ